MSMARLLTFHAHPDDEASKGAPSIAKAVAEGNECFLVCATGGEAGDILNPAMDRPEIRENIAKVRAEELAASGKILGFKEVIYLGYRDSGMPDTEENAHPDCFAKAPIEEAIERLVKIIRRVKPHVIITYADEQLGYQHPDHLRVYDISIPAWERAGDPDYYPDAGEPWTPQKIYYSTWAKARMLAWHETYAELGLESPYDQKWLDREFLDHRITTRIDVTDYYWARRESLLAHATQVDPNEKFWFGLPDDAAVKAYPWDEYILAFSRVTSELPESDLFAGVEV